MQQVTLEEAKSRLADLIDAALRGEEVAITMADQQSVRLVPASAPRRRRKCGYAKGAITMADDFDAPHSDFDEDTR